MHQGFLDCLITTIVSLMTLNNMKFMSQGLLKQNEIRTPNFTKMIATVSCCAPLVYGLSPCYDYGFITPDNFKSLNDVKIVSRVALKQNKVRPPNFPEMITAISCYATLLFGLSLSYDYEVIAPDD